MPDPTKQSVSASQMPCLFGVSPYMSRFMLWHDFKGDAELPLVDPDERMAWGTLHEPAILARTAYDYRARMIVNTERRQYVRRGRIGHTRDGRMLGSGRGRINVEAKNLDFMVWKSDWTETAAPQHIEIQAETGTYVDRCDMTIIAAHVGGNSIRYYERAPRPELQDRIKAETASFFESLKRNREPDPLGVAAELPQLATLYPEANPAKVLERLEDAELRDLLKQYEYGQGQETFGRKLVEAAKPKILALAQDCSVIRANSIECRIAKSEIEEQVEVDREVLFAAQAVRAWARVSFSENVASWPRELQKLHAVLRDPWKVTRNAHISARISTYPRYGDPPLPGDDVIEAVVAAHGGTITP